MTPEQLLAFMIQRGSAWVHAQRTLHRESGRTLTTEEASVLSRFFHPSVLASTRIAFVPKIENPGFYADLAAQGVPMPLDLGGMSGITYHDTILISALHPVPAPGWIPLLFHECVHVAQYGLLGIEDFIRRYITGWALAGFDYFQIPLERDAYELGDRFEADPTTGFDVTKDLIARIAARGSAA
jgi:hypothetical protein